MKKCKVCQKEIVGRYDKIFCSVKCKNIYHRHLSAEAKSVAKRIDSILHRNRNILFELMPEGKSKIRIKRIHLDKKKFNYNYHTHTYINSQGKLYHYIYDFAWMEFSTDDIMIVKMKRA